MTLDQTTQKSDRATSPDRSVSPNGPVALQSRHFCHSNKETSGQRTVARSGDRPQPREALSLIHFLRDLDQP